MVRAPVDSRFHSSPRTPWRGTRDDSPAPSSSRPPPLHDHQSHIIAFDTTSPIVSNVAAQTNAEVKLASWNCQNGISKMPAIKGTDARNGPKNRPIKIPGIPHLFI